MLYNTIYNNPWERSTVTYSHCWWDDGFTDEELNKIIEYCEKDGLDRAWTMGLDPEKDVEQIEKVRKCDIKFFKKTEETNWIFNKFNFIIQELNNQFYGFDLNGYEAFQYTSYDSSEQGKYDWHMDTCLGHEHLPNNMHEPRKLSISLLLNEPGVDFEGGDFQINQGREGEAQTLPFKKGRAVAFPSWVIHRVTPVTKGFRKSAVVWVTGPKFK